MHRDSNTNKDPLEIIQHYRREALSQAREDRARLDQEDPWFCERCGHTVTTKSFELDDNYAILCSECYLADPPADDVAGCLYEIEERLTNERLAAKMVRSMEDDGEGDF